jgi:hypothetical protein
MLNIVMLNVIMLSAVMLSVVAPDPSLSVKDSLSMLTLITQYSYTESNTGELLSKSQILDLGANSQRYLRQKFC